MHLQRRPDMTEEQTRNCQERQLVLFVRDLVFPNSVLELFMRGLGVYFQSLSLAKAPSLFQQEIDTNITGAV